MKNYVFTNNWFKLNMNDIKKSMKGMKIKDILEIGSYEGQSTVFFLQYFNESKLISVDPFMNNGTEYKDKSKSKSMIDVKKRFMMNTSQYSDRIEIKQGTSKEMLPTIKKKFDFIYIDGSHIANDVFFDAVYCWNNLLKVGGVICFDDFMHTNNIYKDLIYLSPSVSIQLFISLIENYKKLHIG